MPLDEPNTGVNDLRQAPFAGVSQDAGGQKAPNPVPPPATQSYTSVLAGFKADIEELKNRAEGIADPVTRELSMFKTKLDEAYLWLRSHVESL